jgi:hypothetical protein
LRDVRSAVGESLANGSSVRQSGSVKAGKVAGIVTTMARIRRSASAIAAVCAILCATSFLHEEIYMSAG